MFNIRLKIKYAFYVEYPTASLSTRRNKFILINTMHKLNCGVLYKKYFFDRVIISVKKSLYSFQISTYCIRSASQTERKD